MTKIAALLLPALGLVAGVVEVAPTDKPAAMFRGDARHTGDYGAEGVWPHALKWRLRTGGKIRATPTVASGLVLAGSEDGFLYAVDAGSGELRWKVDLGAPLTSTAAVRGGTVYAVGGDGHLHALRLVTGEERWTFRTGTPKRYEQGRGDPRTWDFYAGSPLIADDLVVFGSSDGHVYVLDGDEGTLRWKFATEGVVRSTPAVADGTVYVGGMDGKFYALGLADGALRWVFDTEGNAYFPPGEVQSSPAVAGGRVYFGARDGFVYALDAASGELAWRADHRGSWVITSPAVVGGKVFAGSSDGQFFQALAADTGEELWRHETESRVFSSPAVAGGLVYFGTWDGDLYALDVRDGLVKSKNLVESAIMSSPVVAREVIYVGSDDSCLYAFTGPRYDAAKEPTVVSVPAERLTRLVGLYTLDSGGEIEIAPDGEQLVLIIGGQHLALLPTSETEFLLSGAALKVRFVADEGGAIVALELVGDGGSTAAKRPQPPGSALD